MQIVIAIHHLLRFTLSRRMRMKEGKVYRSFEAEEHLDVQTVDFASLAEFYRNSENIIVVSEAGNYMFEEAVDLVVGCKLEPDHATVAFGPELPGTSFQDK